MISNINLLKGDFCISTDKDKLDLTVIHNYLSVESYWCKNVPFDKVKRSIEYSLNFGLYYKDKQAGFARVVSDFTTVAYLGDVFILPGYRGHGHSKWMMEAIMSHPDLQGLRRWILLTRDAHELYKKFGWTEIENPARWMEKFTKDIYL